VPGNTLRQNLKHNPKIVGDYRTRVNALYEPDAEHAKEVAQKNTTVYTFFLLEHKFQTYSK